MEFSFFHLFGSLILSVMHPLQWKGIKLSERDVHLVGCARVALIGSFFYILRQLYFCFCFIIIIFLFVYWWSLSVKAEVVVDSKQLE